VRASQHTGGTGNSSFAAPRSPHDDGTACATCATKQGTTGHSPDREPRPLPHRRLEVGVENTRHPSAEKGDRLLEHDPFRDGLSGDGLSGDGLRATRLLGAGRRRSQIDDVGPGGRHARSPQRGEQLPASFRGCPAPEHHASRAKRRERIAKGSWSFADAGDHQHDRARQLPAQAEHKFPDANRRRSATHITTDDNGRRLLGAHQALPGRASGASSARIRSSRPQQSKP
jgi:hypothetical protein